MYHVTPICNTCSILKNGLVPSCGNGLMSSKDGKTYLTDSLEYINIMAGDIGKWKRYVILKIDIDPNECEPIWWEGKGYKEWTTIKKIPPENINIHKIVRVDNGGEVR